MHPAVKIMLSRLAPIFAEALQEASDAAQQKITNKAADYENLTPVWMRLTKASDYSAIIRIKAERVISELENVTLDEDHEWDDDNAIDLVVYTLFLIAFGRFVKRRELNSKGIK